MTSSLTLLTPFAWLSAFVDTYQEIIPTITSKAKFQQAAAAYTGCQQALELSVAGALSDKDLAKLCAQMEKGMMHDDTGRKILGLIQLSVAK